MPISVNNPPHRLGPATLRVLGVILAAAARGQTLTMREIGGWVGQRYPHGVAVCIYRLVRAGLVSYEPGKSRTIRPTCRVEVVK